jgi:hypothetical protein
MSLNPLDSTQIMYTNTVAVTGEFERVIACAAHELTIPLSKNGTAESIFEHGEDRKMGSGPDPAYPQLQNAVADFRSL